MRRELVIAVIVITVCVVIIVLALSLGIGLGVGLAEEGSSDCTLTGCPNAGVATDAEICSQAGRRILEDYDGNAVDAAVAALLCVGVANLHSTGLGGGGFMLIYNSSTDTVSALDFREISPKQFNVSSFAENHRGTWSIGIPGQLKGMEAAKRMFGNPAVSWETLFTGAKSVAENGDITEAAKFAIGITCSTLSRDDYAGSTYDNMRSFLQCSSGVVPDTLPQPELAATLDMIAKSGGADIFYNSSWTTQLVQELTDIAGEGNIDITVEDFNEYEVIKEGRVIGSTFKDYKVCGVGPPASGSVLALLFNVMDGLELQQRDATTLFQLIEAFKIVCPEYLNIGDPAGNTAVDMAVERMLTPEVATAIRNEIKGYLASGTTSNYTTCYRNQSVSDGANSGLGGTIHLSVVDRRGNAVSLMSSINYFFGSLVYSKETGIAFNNELDDFDPPELTYSPNLPAASKRPRSSAVPTIIADANTRNVQLVAGASGGRRIPPSVLQTILGVLNFNQSLQTSIDGTRIYVTWSDSRNGNFTVQLENDREDFTTELYTELTQLREGENIQLITSRYRAVVQGVYVNDDELVFPYSDTRKFGIADGYRRRRSASLN